MAALAIGALIADAQYTCSQTNLTPQLVEDCVNAVRSNPGQWGSAMCGAAGAAPAMWANNALTTAASWHTSDMAARGFFAHGMNTDLSIAFCRDFSGRIFSAGFTGGTVAENLANGYNTAFDVVAGWMCSPGHRANLVNCAYDSMGTAVDCSTGSCLTTQTYGCSTGGNCCYGGGRGPAQQPIVAGEFDTGRKGGRGGRKKRQGCLLPILCGLRGGGGGLLFG
ncbi:hypothetical protein BSKO_10334 [Bryopsis sp. KO-2023]|nr:hypothetical protein BSKO_10334 [Bryopsis sp. KO-2023]